MNITETSQVIPERNIVFFAPHFDDVLFCIGGYIDSLRENGLLDSKTFHIHLLFSRSNYQARDESGNVQTDDQRIQYASGIRLIEDQNCLDALIGKHQYRYQLHGFSECFARGKQFADSEMEFPHGMFEDFDQQDHELFQQCQNIICEHIHSADTALIFPTAIKEHIDHFIVREAAIQVAKEQTSRAASIYFAEDKPYGGLATEEELARYQLFIDNNKLGTRAYHYDPQRMIEFAFTYYPSQVEDCYRDGIEKRALVLSEEYGGKLGVDLLHCL